MIRRDYILRAIEEFIKMLARISRFKKGQLWEEADAALDAEFKRLAGAGAQAVSQMSETELWAKLLQGEPTQVMRYKLRLLATLLHEAGDVAMAQNRMEDGRACYLKGLNLLLGTIDDAESPDFLDFVPKVEAFVTALQDSPLPLNTQALLMQHYERAGAFGKAEDLLFAILEAEPNQPKLLDFGVAFYRRLKTLSDAALVAGNLPREELDAGLAELESRKASLPVSGHKPGRPRLAG